MAEGAIITAIKTKDGDTHQLGVTQAHVDGLVSALESKANVSGATFTGDISVGAHNVLFQSDSTHSGSIACSSSGLAISSNDTDILIGTDAGSIKLVGSNNIQASNFTPVTSTNTLGTEDNPWNKVYSNGIVIPGKSNTDYVMADGTTSTGGGGTTYTTLDTTHHADDTNYVIKGSGYNSESTTRPSYVLREDGSWVGLTVDSNGVLSLG